MASKNSLSSVPALAGDGRVFDLRDEDGVPSSTFGRLMGRGLDWGVKGPDLRLFGVPSGLVFDGVVTAVLGVLLDGVSSILLDTDLLLGV